MELSTAGNDLQCNLCLFQVATRGDECNDSTEELMKKQIFHEACHKCDNAKPRSLVKLCNLCRHLRVRHLLLCIPHTSMIVEFQPFRKESKHCDFCRFIATYAKGNSCVELRFEGSVAYGDHGDLHAISPAEARLQLRSYIDWEWLRHWLKDLSKMSEGRLPERRHMNFLPRQELQDLHVIDVSQACVIQLPPEAEYIALSYVWGTASVGQFQALRSNISKLETPGSLEGIDLPLTIRDAILACKLLHYRFLWVDRLCIVQDQSWDGMMTQLSQMASVYHRAALTFVGLAGDGATYGLPGVTRPRRVKQGMLRFDEHFELAEGMPSIFLCVDHSKWGRRGWTYQESMASSTVLFFTNFGLFHQRRLGLTKRTHSEAPGTQSGLAEDDNFSLDIISEYTRRRLTYPSDILRSISGILHAVYGDQTSFGMPWDDFHRAILWGLTEYHLPPRESTKTDLFPTWSWTSASGPVRFETLSEVYSLAYWGRASKRETGSLSYRWVAIEAPVKDNWSNSSHEKPPIDAVAALAWLNGCIRSEVPACLLVDCSKEEYNKRLAERWPGRDLSYWHDAFRSYEGMKVFDDVDVGLLDALGCIAVHTQKASLTLDWRDQTHRKFVRFQTNRTFTNFAESNLILVRTSDHRVAGGFYLDNHSVQKLRTSDQKEVCFIALSVSRREPWEVMVVKDLGKHLKHLNTSEFYGCPCSSHIGATTEPNHIVECPKHVDFSSTVPFQPWPLTGEERQLPEGEERQRALSKHLADLSYHDIHGDLLHAWNEVPELHVMMIIPSGIHGKPRKLYQRLGIGKIYLKRWVEASPRFETIVLE